MNFFLTIYTAFLFIILSPGVLFTLPRKSKKKIVFATHGVIFALIFHFTHNIVLRITNKFEGFTSEDSAVLKDNLNRDQEQYDSSLKESKPEKNTNKQPTKVYEKPEYIPTKQPIKVYEKPEYIPTKQPIKPDIDYCNKYSKDYDADKCKKYQ